jgi:hypothetical protein
VNLERYGMSDEQLATWSDNKLRNEWRSLKSSMEQARLNDQRRATGMPPSIAMGDTGVETVKAQLKALKRELQRRGKWRRGAR